MSTTSKASIYYDIITEYNGKGAKTAATSFGSLDSLGKKLAKTLATTFSVVAIERFGKASLDAFTKDQKALTLLNQSLLNLGQGFEAPGVGDFIKNLSLATGAAKESLIPAFQLLDRYTMDVGKSQTLLQLAMDISAGTGKDLTSVSTALGKAYGGQTTALGRLGVGLTKVQLANKDFSATQGILTAMFKGEAAAAADTYQGRLDRMNVAFTEMKVTIGEGLVTAFETLAGSGGSIDKAISAISNLGYGFSGFLQSVAGGFKWISDTISKDPIIKYLMHLTGAGKTAKGVLTSWVDTGKLTAFEAQARANTKLLEQSYKTQITSNNAITAAKKAQAALDAKSLQAAKDKAKLEKDSAVLKLAGSVFDLSQIEIVAAMTRQVSDDSQLRLSLQLALLQGNAEAAGKLSQKLIETQIAALQVQASDPFALMNTHILDALNSLNQLYAAMLLLNTGKTSAWQAAVTAATQSNAFAYQQAGFDVLGGTFSGSQDNSVTPADLAIAAATLSNAQDTIDQGGNILGGTFGGSTNGSDFFSNSSSYNPLSGMTVNVMIDPATLTSVVTTGQQNVTAGGIVVGTTRINAPAIG